MRQADGAHTLTPTPTHACACQDHTPCPHTHIEGTHTLTNLHIYAIIRYLLCPSTAGCSSTLFGCATLSHSLSLSLTQPQQLVATRTGQGRAGSAWVAHSMSLVTPNTNTLNVNNEVTHGTARHGSGSDSGNGHCPPCCPCPQQLRQLASVGVGA